MEDASPSTPLHIIDNPAPSPTENNDDAVPDSHTQTVVSSDIVDVPAHMDIVLGRGQRAKVAPKKLEDYLLYNVTYI